MAAMTKESIYNLFKVLNGGQVSQYMPFNIYNDFSLGLDSQW